MVKNNPLTDGRLKKHYKMYKAGKLWLYSSLLVSAMSGVIISEKPAHAAVNNDMDQLRGVESSNQSTNLQSQQVVLSGVSQSSSSQVTASESGLNQSGQSIVASSTSNSNSGLTSATSTASNVTQTGTNSTSQDPSSTANTTSLQTQTASVRENANDLATEKTTSSPTTAVNSIDVDNWDELNNAISVRENANDLATEKTTSSPTTAVNSIDVDNWDELNNAISQGDYNVINITCDIDGGSSKNGSVKIKAGSIADRDLTINGNGHTINFANNDYVFDTAGNVNRTITLNDLTFKSIESGTSLAYYPKYGVFCFEDNKGSVSANAHHTLVFNNINYQGITLFRSYDYDSPDASGSVYPANNKVIFKGNNNITIQDFYKYNGTTYTSNTLNFSGLPAVQASQIEVQDGTTTIADRGVSVVQTYRSGSGEKLDGALTIDPTAKLILTGGVTDLGSGHHAENMYAREIEAILYAAGTINVNGGQLAVNGPADSTYRNGLITNYMKAGIASDMGTTSKDPALTIQNGGSVTVTIPNQTSSNKLSAGLYVAGDQDVDVNNGTLAVNMGESSTTASAIGIHNGTINVNTDGNVKVENHNNDSAIHLEGKSSTDFGSLAIRKGGAVTVIQHGKTTDGAIGASKNGHILVDEGGQLTVNNSIDASNQTGYKNESSIDIDETGNLQVNGGQVNLNQTGTVQAITIASGGHITVDNNGGATNQPNLVITNTSDTAGGNVISLGNQAIMSFGKGANANVSYTGSGKVNLVSAQNANLIFSNVNNVNFNLADCKI